jgi:SecD/SecF fusion protein
VIAVIASLLLIAIYIGFRFEWKFAVPVMIALAHDLLITAGVYALFDREVTTATVAALLTIMGYSLYDTVIVFDRIRENVPRMPRATFSQIANRSMSEVFTRSLATSFVVLMPVGSLLLFGGETLKDFAFALLVGVLSGAYSSIFIATPVLVEWKEREQTYMRRRRVLLEQFGGRIPAFATGTLGEPAPAAATPAAGAGAAAPAAAAPEPAAPTSRAARRQRRAQASRTTSTTRTAPRPPAPPRSGDGAPRPGTGDGAPPPSAGDGAPPPGDGDGAPPTSQPPERTAEPSADRAAEPSAETPASPSAPAAPSQPPAPPRSKQKQKSRQKRRKHGRR